MVHKDKKKQNILTTRLVIPDTNIQQNTNTHYTILCKAAENDVDILTMIKEKCTIKLMTQPPT